MIPPLDRNSGSWIVSRKDTGSVVGEFYSRRNVERFDPDKVIIETAAQYLGRINTAPTIKTYRNRRESAAVVMDGDCLGAHRVGGTCVRQTVDGRYAVIATRGDRLIRTFDDALHARRYNFAIHGDRLGE